MSDGVDDAVAQEVPADFRALLDKLSARHNFDFREYKEGSLARRIRTRMAQVHIDSFANYSVFLDANPDEYVELFNTILINVTGFFRDFDAWKALEQDAVPRLIDAAGASRGLRIWSAGCSSPARRPIRSPCSWPSTSARRPPTTRSRSTAPTSTKRRSPPPATRCTGSSSSKMYPTACSIAISPATVSSIASAATSAAGASSAATTSGRRPRCRIST